MADWAALVAELEAWRSAGRSATVWWRDDDAVAPSPALHRLLETADRRGVPIALAVIPAHAESALAARLFRSPRAAVMQHGWAHRNHAAQGAKKSELGPERPMSERLAELAEGRRRLDGLFGERSLPVLVPPWNRLAPDLPPRLPEAGLRGLSTFRPRERAVAGLVQANTHLDPVDWHGGRRFLGEGTAVAALVDHLARRRAGSVDPDEPTGLLTHHAVMDEEGWAFLERLLPALAHPAARWLSAREIFAPAPADEGEGP